MTFPFSDYSVETPLLRIEQNVLAVYLGFRVTNHPYFTSQLSIFLFNDWSKDLTQPK